MEVLAAEPAGLAASSGDAPGSRPSSACMRLHCQAPTSCLALGQARRLSTEVSWMGISFGRTAFRVKRGGAWVSVAGRWWRQRERRQCPHAAAAGGRGPDQRNSARFMSMSACCIWAARPQAAKQAVAHLPEQPAKLLLVFDNPILPDLKLQAPKEADLARGQAQQAPSRQGGSLHVQNI